MILRRFSTTSAPGKMAEYVPAVLQVVVSE